MDGTVQQLKSVDSKCFKLSIVFAEKYTVDFYQREYVWERKQLEDLINDLSNAFLKCWDKNHSIQDVKKYDPYFMGEVVLSTGVSGRKSIIDGQQRITTFTLLLMYMLNNYRHIDKFPEAEIQNAIYSNDFGEKKFNLEIETRNDCMLSLFENGYYVPNDKDRTHVQNIVDRYNDIGECWNDKIDINNIAGFAYWILEKIVFSKVEANSDDFAYVIFETMNDRGLSLTQVEMLRSYLLANINSSARSDSLERFDKAITKLNSIKLSSKSKVENEFFKIYLRCHYAEDMSQNRDRSDFVVLGNAFHRWVRENEKILELNKSDDYVRFIKEIEFYINQYEKIQKIISDRNTSEYFYLVVNADYGFTLQSPLILAAIKYGDSEETVDAKIQLISKYITKVLSWRVWNHWMISQSSLEAPIYDLCKKIRNVDEQTLREIIASEPIKLPELNNPPILNQQNKRKIRVLIALITEIVAKESNESDYLLNKPDMEIEHIWSNHYEKHSSEFSQESEFATARDTIGDLLILPKSFNASYNDSDYDVKVKQYFSQNILAQTLNSQKYLNSPGFTQFIKRSNLQFKGYDEFNKEQIDERSTLYRNILKWNWD